MTDKDKKENRGMEDTSVRLQQQLEIQGADPGVWDTDLNTGYTEFN